MSYPVGAGPRATALADFNRDGRLDVVVVGDGGTGTSGGTGIPSVSIRFGGGDGTFGPAAIYQPVGSAAVNVAVGDLNGDGAPDLVVAMINSSSLAVLLNHGDGTFGASYTAASGDSAVAIVDWNGDGKQDIVATSYWSSTAIISLGNGDGTFAAPQSYSVGQNPFGLVVADLNHDGVLDLATTDDTTNSITVLLFSSPVTVAKRLSLKVGQWPFGIAAADMNRDGNLDLVTGNSASNDVSVLYGDGLGNFAAAQNFPAGTGPRHIAVADVNGDALPDIIVADAEGSTLALLLANTTSFSPAVLMACPTTPYGVAIADLDHDNRADIVTGNRTSNDALVYLRRTPCKPPDAYIVTDGPLTFCIGGSVTLTANGSGTYLWSTGATSQSITVTQSGTYSVTVTADAGCSATSAAVVVNAGTSQIAQTTITPDGPTTFCSGGAVNLTASAADSYLWSNGQKTQTIHVTEGGSYSVTSAAKSGLQLIRSDTIPPNNVKTFPMTQACTETTPGSGVFPQLCNPIHNVTVNTGSTLRIPSLVANTCSSVRFNIYVDGALRYTTPFLTWDGAAAPFSSLPRNAGPIDLGAVNPGTHSVGFQAEGQNSGCDTTGIGAWAATGWIETIETYQAVPLAVVTDRAMHRAYVSFSYQSEPDYPGRVMIVDTASDQPITTIDLGAQAGRAALNARTHKLYIASASAGVTVVDTLTNTVAAHINVGGAASGVAVNPVTNRIYVTLNGYKLVILDGNTDAVLQTVTLSVQYPGEIAVNSNLNKIYITEDSGTSPLVVVDGNTNTEVKTITTITAVAMAVDEVSNRLFVGSLQGSADINVFDRDEALIHTIPQFGSGAEYVRGIAFDDIRNVIYRPHLNSGEVDAIDGATYALIKTVATGSNRLYYAGIDPDANKIYMLERDSFEAGRPRLEGRIHFLSGDFSCNSTSLPVAITVNATPQVNAGLDQAVTEGSTFTLNASVTHAVSAKIAWGDGAVTDPAAIVSGVVTATHVFIENGTYTVAVAATSDSGCTSSDDLVVTVVNAVPAVGAITAPAKVAKNIAVSSSASFTDPGVADTHTAVWSWGDGTTSTGTVTESAGSGSVTGSHSYTTPGTYTITLTVTDDDGGSGTNQYQSVLVYDPAPVVAAANATVAVTEGQTASNTGSYSDSDGDPVTISASIGTITQTGVGNGTWTWSFASVDGPAQSQAVVVSANDGHGNITTTSFALTVSNVAPVVGAISWAPSVDGVKIGTLVTATSSFSDAGVLDTHTATVDWGDGSALSAGTVNESNGAGTATASHSYTVAGLYTVTLTVTDKDGGSAQTVFQYVAAFDTLRSLSGSGAISSPAGSYPASPSLTGSASYSALTAKYAVGAAVPSGTTSFVFAAAGLNFSSSTYKWLVASSGKAWLRGSGNVTINGVNQACQFLIAAVDGPSFTTDYYRIKIWTTSAVVYDDQITAADASVATVPATTGPGSITIK